MDNQIYNIIRVITMLATIILCCVLYAFGWLLYTEWKQPIINSTQMIDYVDIIRESAPFIPDNLAIGKDLFWANCASCHNRNMQDNLTGPALGGVTDRWSKYPLTDLYNFIRDSQQMIKKRHLQAMQVWNEYKPVIMAPFPNLKDEEIEAIVVYIEYVENGAI